MLHALKFLQKFSVEVIVTSYDHGKERKTMGMAAGQARLLSITARLTDNENTAQGLSYSKQRLADETEQINAEYLKALDATKLTVLTGFNGAEPNYTDISYGLMTGYQTVALGKQYVVTNAKGQILVTKKQAEAFEKGNGDLNVFLANMTRDTDNYGYSIVDVNIREMEDEEAGPIIHDAWDKYFTSIGKHFTDREHGPGTLEEPTNPDVTPYSGNFGYTSFKKGSGYYNGYATYDYGNGPEEINYEGTTKEQRELFDYAVALTEARYNESSSTGSLHTVYEDSENAGYIQYLKNIFNQMRQFGYYTEKDETDTINGVNVYKGGSKSTSWFETQLKEGKLLLKAYSSTDKDFIPVTLSDDDAIQEVSDDRQVTLVEAKYTQDIAALERKDKKIDLELKKLDTEHNALQTEYEAAQSIIKSNVEKSFNIFS